MIDGTAEAAVAAGFLFGVKVRGGFPQQFDVHITLTEKIHSDRIAAKQGQLRSGNEANDEQRR